MPVPAIQLEVPIEGEDITGVQFFGQVNQAGVGKIGRQITIPNSRRCFL